MVLGSLIGLGIGMAGGISVSLSAEQKFTVLTPFLYTVPIFAVKLACNPARAAELRLHACMQVGNHLFAHAEKVDLRKYDIAADKDESIPTPEPPDGQTVSGKPREFLKYAPMWAAHPDHDRVRFIKTHAWKALQVCCPCTAPGLARWRTTCPPVQDSVCFRSWQDVQCFCYISRTAVHGSCGQTTRPPAHLHTTLSQAGLASVSASVSAG